MNQQHPITPPPELVQQWQKQAPPPAPGVERITHIATHAARWGADQELEACLKAIISQIITIDNIGLSGPAGVLHTETCSSWPAFAHMVSRQLRAARRPRPPSLREQALAEMELLETHGVHACCLETLRRALESLPDPQD